MTACKALLSICLRCRDGREAACGDRRGGARLARAILDLGSVPPGVSLRGVHCMSQCKRPCVVSLTAAGRFTWVFGDLDPMRHAAEVLALLPIYQAAPDGFLTREARPEALRASILGRLPPPDFDGDLVQPLTPDFQPEPTR